MSHKVHRPTTHRPHNLNKIVNKHRDPIPIPPTRRLPRLPTPPNVIPHDMEPLLKQRDDPIPHGSIVGIAMHKDDRRPAEDPALVDGQPHPTSLNPPSTHNPTVAARPDSACAKLRPVTTEPT